MRPLDPRLVRQSGAVRPYLVATTAVGLATTVLVALQAWLLADAITSAFLGGGDLGTVGADIGWLAVTLVGRAALTGAQEWLSRATSARVQADLRMRLLDKVFELGPSWLAQRRSADIAVLATRGIRSLDSYFSQYLPQAVLAALVPLVVLGCLLPADPVAFVTVALTVPLIPVFMALVGLTTRDRTERQWSALQRLGHHFLDVVSGLPTLKIYGRGQVQRAVVARKTDEYRRTTMGTLRLAFLSSLVLELVATLSVALVAVAVGLRLLRGDLDLRTALFVLVLAPEAYLPLRRMGAAHHASAEGLEAAQRMFEVIDADVARYRSQPGPLTGSRVSALQVVGLDVRRDTCPELVVRDFDADVPRGRFVVITGPSGAGKSTVLETILGFVHPERGLVRVVEPDGTASLLGAVELPVWRRQFAYVPQRPYVIAGTVAQNVRLGAPALTDETVRRSLAVAGGLLDELPEGAQTPVGEGGHGLSTGQVRRLALARALVQDRPILLLDEPTAGLDPETEARVLKALLDRPHGQTVLVVSHRPAVIAAADLVVTMTPRRQDAAA